MSLVSDCANCKATQSVDVRQFMACGYELPVEGASAWQHRSGEAVTDTCPGYLVNLPEVIEGARARNHWKHGSLRDFCEGQPSEGILQAVEIIDGAAHEVESFVMGEKR